MGGTARRAPRRSGLALLVTATVALVAPVPALAARTTVAFRVLTVTLVDTSRPTVDPANPAGDAPTRTLRTVVYVPRGKGPFPLVLMAHGGDGNPDEFTQLLGAWAGAGYAVAAPAFPLTSNRSPKPLVAADYLNQPADLSFVLTQVLARAKQQSSPLYRRVDPRHIGAAGLSLGGTTVFGLASCCRDPRIDALLLMDPVSLPFATSVVAFHTPVTFIHIDTDPVAPYATSAQAFAAAPPPKFLMTLHGGLHAEPYEDTPSPHDAAVIGASTAFWDAYLRGERRAVAEISRAGTVPAQSDVVAVPR
jgi:predicted dienelactone hydrolase